MTDTHHDAGGYCTYFRCDVGAKISGYVEPKTLPTTLRGAMQAYHSVVVSSTANLQKFAKPVQVLLTPGYMLIQPPGVLHLVYTVENSIFTGGHFYTMDTMHLAEVARTCAVFSDQCGTNVSHPGSTRLLSRIALSLVFNWTDFVLRKPFISLARMLLWAHLYAAGDDESASSTTFDLNLESRMELAAAQAVIKAILAYNDLNPDNIRPHAFKEFRWLSDMGEGSDWTDWKDPGTVRLRIPDMRGCFAAFGLIAA